jgi:hypothetical protein
MSEKIKYLMSCLRLVMAFSVLLLTASEVQAQSQIRATASIDTTIIRIGEQFHINLTATVPSDAHITFPAIADSIHKLEVVQRSNIDTTKTQDGKFSTYHQSLTVTGFDSGFFVIEPFTFSFTKKGAREKDSLVTEALLMQVQTIPVDTTKEIKDIKPPVDVPFTFREALPYILVGIAAVALVWGIVYWMKKRKRKPQEAVKKVPARPPHEIAIDALKKIQEQKLWQQGFYKEYHSAVADTIRTYIEGRFGILAMEMPSDDTLTHFRNNLIIPEAFEKLRYLLQSADMVKFAKGIPVGSENELSMQHAFDFIALTKPASKEDFETVVPEEKKEVMP